MSFKRSRALNFFRFAALLAALLLPLWPLQPASVQAGARQPQRRDFITDVEADRVREAQLIDRRVIVFIKIIERRISALTEPSAATSKQALKDAETWGALRTGTRAELLSDIAGTLDAAITNIDDASQRAPQNPLAIKALRKLAEASTQLLAKLNAMRSTTTTDEKAREALEQAIDNAQTIIQAAGNLPAVK